MKADYDERRVVVVTPVYNTAEFLAECIESVLAQTYADFDYIVVDNASTDESLAIASAYAERDPRLKVLSFQEHLEQLPNYDRALNCIEGGYEYCKFAQADDVIYPTCIEQLVRVADTDPEITMVGAYTILQNRVFLDGLNFSQKVIDGRDVVRDYLYDGPYIVGTPTTGLYRFREVKKHKRFFSDDAIMGDADAAFRTILDGKLGFVHQVLSLARVRPNSVSDKRERFEVDALTRRVVFERHGREVLSEEEFESVRRRLVWRHRRVLGKAALRLESRDFWDYHRKALAVVGKNYSYADVAVGALIEFFRAFFNLESVLRGLWRRLPFAKQ